MGVVTVLRGVVRVNGSGRFFTAELRLIMGQIEAHLDLGLVLRVLHGVVQRPEVLGGELKRFLRLAPLVCRRIGGDGSVVRRIILNFVVLSVKEARKLNQNSVNFGSRITYLLHVREVVMRNRDIVQILHIPKNTLLQESRLLPEELQARIGVHAFAAAIVWR